MPEERRQSSMDNILLAIGELKATTVDTNNKVGELNVKVAIQNGRIGKLELEKAKQDGFIKGLTILVSVLLLPVVLIVISEIISRL